MDQAFLLSCLPFAGVQCELSEVEVDLFEVAGLVAETEVGLDPTAGEQVGPKDPKLSAGDVEHEPLKIGPDQVGSPCGRDVEFVEQEHRRGGCAADAAHGLVAGEIVVVFVE